MRASTLFGMTIAILIGMAVVVGVKSAGLFDRKLPDKVSPDRPRILVAKTNLFADLAATADSVMIRPVDDSELDQYLKNRHKYMPPILEAASFRVLARNVHANEPLMKEHFQDLGLPGSYNEFLEPGMRAVNVQMPRDRAGVIRKNDRVDVFLTTSICADPSCSNPITATAPIALGLKVVVKRDSIWTMMLRDDESKPIPFTLQANPYRAALIEFAKSKGTLMLMPTGPSGSQKKTGMPMENEGKDEEQRVINLVERSQPITDRDLEDIFKLTAIERKGSPGVDQIERWHGIVPRGGHTFARPGENTASGPSMPTFQTADGRAAHGYRFLNPSGGFRTEPCSTCPGGKRVVPQ